MTSPNLKQKRSNSRPCDACAIRRVRCDVQQNPDGVCTNCKNHQVQCTNVRIRHKSGPKKIKQKTRDSIVELINSTSSSSPGSISDSSTFHKTLTLNQTLPLLQIYQTWFYCIWPIVNVTQLISKITAKTEGVDNPLVIDDINIAQQYALSCAVCAAISRHRQFLKSAGDSFRWENFPSPYDYAAEARRVIYEFDLRGVATTDFLLTNYFLHCYYCNVPNGSQKSLVYLREAISIAHVLKLHEPGMYTNKPSAECHRYRKIYYQLLITERFVAFESGIPVLLEPTIPTPSQEDEEYPDLLLGFTELTQVFAVTDKEFFQELQSKVLNKQRINRLNNVLQSSKISKFQDFIHNKPLSLKKKWLLQLQKKLDRGMQNENALLDSQKANILVSKAWFQSIGWLISCENMWVEPNAPEECFSLSYPLKITGDFLNATIGLPDFAFEANGPGVSMKLLGVADSLYSFTLMTDNEVETILAFEQLNTIYNLIVRFKNDMELPHSLYNKIGTALISRKIFLDMAFPVPQSSGSIELLDDNDNFHDKTDDLLAVATRTYDTPSSDDTSLSSELLRELSTTNLRSLFNMDFGTNTTSSNNLGMTQMFNSGTSNYNFNNNLSFQTGMLTNDY